MIDFLNYLIDLIPRGLVFITLFTSLIIYIIHRFPGWYISKILSRKRVVFILLIIWIVMGSAGLDYNLRWGCIYSSVLRFSQTGLIFTGIEMLFISTAFFIPNRIISAPILCIELCIWLYKLLFIKGGYAVGFGGIPDPGVVAYDFFALLLRLWLINNILKIRINTYIFILTSFIVLCIKIIYFEAPAFTF